MNGVHLTHVQCAAVACWLDGLSRRDAAAAIGCTPGAYSMALMRALRLLGQAAVLPNGSVEPGTTECRRELA